MSAPSSKAGHSEASKEEASELPSTKHVCDFQVACDNGCACNCQKCLDAEKKKKKKDVAP